MIKKNFLQSAENLFLVWIRFFFQHSLLAVAVAVVSRRQSIPIFLARVGSLVKGCSCARTFRHSGALFPKQAQLLLYPNYEKKENLQLVRCSRVRSPFWVAF
jgi:hypothetical protein